MATEQRGVNSKIEDTHIFLRETTIIYTQKIISINISEINHNNIELEPQKIFKFMFFVERMIVKMTIKNLPSFFVS